jgi:hypothetical protein
MPSTDTLKRTKKQLRRLVLPALLLSLTATPAHAFQLSDIDQFKTLVQQAGSTPSTFTFANATKSVSYTFSGFDELQTQAINATRAIGNITSITSVLNFQGSTINFNATQANGKQLYTLSSTDIPALNGVFNSAAELNKYLTDYRASIITQSNNASLGNQAANPASHVSQMAYYDSVLDSNGVAAGNVTGYGLSAGDNTATKSRFTSNFRFANYTYGVTSSKLYTLSLGYNWELGNGWGILANMPLTYVDTGVGSNSNASYRVSLGAGVRIPLSNYLKLGSVKWDIIPLFRVGGVGLGSELYNNTSVAYSGGVQSNIGAGLGYGFSVVLQNQYTYNIDTSLASTVLNITVPDTKVHVYRNGVQLIKDFDAQLFGKTISSSFSFADVRFDSSAQSKFDNQQEFGLNIGLKGDGVAANLVRLNLTYTTAQGYSDAFSVNIGGSF